MYNTQPSFIEKFNQLFIHSLEDSYKEVIIAHHDDADGIVSCGLVKAFIEKNYDKVKIFTLKCSYGSADLSAERLGEIYKQCQSGREHFLFVVDYFLDLSVLLKSFQYNNKFISFNGIFIIDHHDVVDRYTQSVLSISYALKQSFGQDFIDKTLNLFIDKTKAACQLCYMFVNNVAGTKFGPDFINYLGNYDIHKVDENFSEYEKASSGFLTNGIDIDNSIFLSAINYLDNDCAHRECKRFLEYLLTAGDYVEKYKKQISKNMLVPKSFIGVIRGKKFICLNSPLSGSYQLESIYDSEKFFGICLFHFNGKQWFYTLYDPANVHTLVDIAESYGGGGHRCACGFRSDGFFIKRVEE